MEVFYNTLGFCGGIAIALGSLITASSLYFRVARWIAGDDNLWKREKIDGELTEHTLVTIHLPQGKLERVRIVGFLRSNGKQPFPYELGSLIIIDNEQGQRTFLRAREVRRIEMLNKPRKNNNA